jgi:hypothetical protein
MALRRLVKDRRRTAASTVAANGRTSSSVPRPLLTAGIFAQQLFFDSTTVRQKFEADAEILRRLLVKRT